MNKPKLKYLFVVEYTDGTTYHQTPEDKSKLDPDKRSEFYDVLQSGKTIKRFSLVEDTRLALLGMGNKITVDLTTGLFEVNGLPILFESEQLPTKPKRFELVFYRQWTRDQNVTYDIKTGNMVKREEAGVFCEYFIGWECVIKGKHYQQKLALS